MKHIAMIDDSEIVLEAATAALNDAGFRVTTMTTPQRDKLTGEDAPDLVLVDVNMPEAFGDDVARFLKESWEVPAPIYLYSSLAEHELKLRTVDAHASGFICKTWGISRLVATVQHITGWRAPQDQPKPAPNQEQGIFGRFATRCEERSGRILDLIDRQEPAATDGQLSGLDPIGFELHDWIGEAKLLGFDKLAAAIDALNSVLKEWGGTVRQGTQSVQLRKWIDGLTSISKKMAVEPPNSVTARALQTLRSELAVEQSGAGSTTDRSKTPTSGAFPVISPQRRVLVFDDSPIVGEALALELGAKGHDVKLASSYADFNRLLATYKPGILFIDINMPEIQGDEVCRRLRARPDTVSVPVIFLSSLPEEELASLARRAGANGYLSKQRGMEDLTRYLDELLEEIIF